MREDKVKLFNPLPSHSSPLHLSLPLSSLSLKLGFDLDFGARIGGATWREILGLLFSSSSSLLLGKSMIYLMLSIQCILMPSVALV